MNGMLLAAGRGARMEPLSSCIAKPALPVLGRPLLSSSLDHLRAAGCLRIAANLHRHPDQVASALAVAAAGGPPVLLSRERELLGGAGGVAAARGVLGQGPVLVANADVWTALDLAPLLAAMADDAIVLGLLPHPDPARWSSVLLEEDGRVAALVGAGKPVDSTPFLFTGFQLVGAAVVAALPPPPGEWRPVWAAAQRRGALRGAVVSGRWCEAGTPGAYRELVVAELGGAAWAAAGAVLAGGSALTRSAVEAGCTVGCGAKVIDSVLLPAAAVGRAARVERCVVVGPAHIAAGEEVADTLVLPDRREPLH
jgi:NDP-sugar pyrophosphorylase family protein